MKYQKICIIGDGLAGLTTAMALKDLNLNVDLFYKKLVKKKKVDKRTTSISETNYKFLEEIIDLKKQNFIWPCREMNLFFEDKGKLINFLNYKEKQTNLLYTFENCKLKTLFFKRLKREKKVNFYNKNIEEINYDDCFIKIRNNKIYYDLIILCLGNESLFYKKIFNSRSIKKNYNEVAITANISHKLKINSASQFFLKEGPLAFLPINKKNFSLVWSVSNQFYKKNLRSIKKIINEKIHYVLNTKKNVKISLLQFFPITLNLKNKYYEKNVLIMGQGIHSIHPLAGQGFNLILRDIRKLKMIIKKNLNLGIGIKNSYLLKDLNNSRNPENTIFGLGVDLVHTFFKENKLFDPFKNILLKNIGKYESIKKISRTISNKGIYF